jgi:hypothetical protein
MLFAPLLFITALAEGAAPTPDQLIEKAIALNKAQDARALKYTWREDEERRDDKGQPQHPFLKTYDVIMLEGDSYRKLILEDGQPLDAKTAKKVEENLEKTREERKKHKILHKTIHMGDLETLPRLFDSKVTGEEVIGGRKTWRIESDPKAGIKPANQGEEEILATHRVTWFDQEEGFDLRRSTTYPRKINKIDAGTHGEFEFAKVGDVWLPASQIFRGGAHFFPGINAFGDIHIRYYDYKRFTSESTFTPN